MQLEIQQHNPGKTTKLEKKSGWRIDEWCAATGIKGRSTYYALPAEIAPASVRVRTMHIIVESPADWLQRVGRKAA